VLGAAFALALTCILASFSTLIQQQHLEYHQQAKVRASRRAFAISPLAGSIAIDVRVKMLREFEDKQDTAELEIQ
jgi:hypothetical protein